MYNSKISKSGDHILKLTSRHNLSMNFWSRYRKWKPWMRSFHFRCRDQKFIDKSRIYESVLQYFRLREWLSVFCVQQCPNDVSAKSYFANLRRIILPCRFFLQNQNRVIFHEDISNLVKLFQIVRKLEYISYTKWPCPKSAREK